MRVDPSRTPALALWFAAILAIAGSPMDAPAQGPPPGGLRGAPPGPAGGQFGPPGQAGGQFGPPGGQFGPPGQGQPPGAPAPEADAAGRKGPVDHDAVPADTSPLARYIPSDAAGAFLEFQGLNAAPDAWEGSSASAMLEETSLGEMIRELLTQFIESAPGAPAGVMTGPEVVAVLEHLARHGLILAAPRDESSGGSGLILVLRNAAHREVRPLFGKLIGTVAASGAKPQVVSKAGNRQVVVMDTPAFGLEGGGDWAWWIEQNDLVVVFDGPEAADRVIAVLDGQAPSAEDDPHRQDLLAEHDGLRPIAVGTLRLDLLGESGRALASEAGLQRLDLRWGFDGEDSLTVVDLLAPAPRQGVMAAFDQPAIPLSELPPIPREVANLTILSADPGAIYDALLAAADQAMPDVARRIREVEQASKTRGRVDLRTDILAALGPKIAAYTLPKPASRPAAGSNPLARVMDALGGLSLPQFVVAIEVKDAAAFIPKLDGMMIGVNQQLASLLPPPEPPPADPGAAGGLRGGPPGPPGQPRGGQREAERPEPPKFTMTSSTPRTYILNLPEGLYALTGYRPTITLGEHYLILGSNPQAVVRCRQLERAQAADRWAPPADLAGRLPGNLTMLVVSDPSESLPSSIAALPAALNAAMAQAAAAAPPEGERAGDAAGPGGPPGGPAGSARGGPAGASGPQAGYGAPGEFGAAGGFGPPGAGEVPPGYGPQGAAGGGFPPGYGPAGASGYPGAPGGPGAAGGPGGPGQRAPAPTIRIPQTLIPTADQLRPYLGTALYTISADDGGIRIQARETIPGQWGFDGLGVAPSLSLPIPLPFGGGN